MAKKKVTNYYRISIQYLVLVMLAYMVARPWIDKSYTADFEAYCPFGGMQATSGYLVSNTLACSMTTTQIAMGIALVLGVILFAKLFCSYVCPIGTFTEWLGRMGEKLKMRYTIKGWPDKSLRILKYGLLFITFYFTLTASELFCRKFDPYYAVLSGFSGDVSMLYAFIALGITILGSFFIRQFWCKYLCPLGAVTNIFAFPVPFVAITVLYILLVSIFKLPIGWVWYLGAVCIAALLHESLRVYTHYVPLVKVSRHESACTKCKICDKACPYGISVSPVHHVRHIDCNLCGDCVTRCPEKGALKMNGRNMRWLPPLVVLVLIGGALLFSSFTEIPTINQQWGTEQQMKTAGVIYQSGLKGVKCFGSSMAFANQMKEIRGVVGVQTYVKEHAVKIFYDPSMVKSEDIKKAIFTPVKEIIRIPGKDSPRISIIRAGINNFFDPGDAALLSELFKQQTGIFAFETQFGEPVETVVYFDKNKISPDKIRQLIGSKSVSFKDGDILRNQKMDFKVASFQELPESDNRTDFIRELFTPYDKTFNDYDNCDSTKLLQYQVAFPQCLEPEKADMVPYLRNHMMSDKALVRFRTILKEADPYLLIYYIEGKTTPEAISGSLNKAKLHVQYKDGSSEDLDNPFRFPVAGITVK